jgi:hypothetical protein
MDTNCAFLSLAPSGVCSLSRNTTSGMEGWWGGLSARLTSLQQCYVDDLPAGLHWIRYRHPANFSMPDEVNCECLLLSIKTLIRTVSAA